MDSARSSHSLSPPSLPKNHPPHQGCPNSLSCLSDSDAKPRDTFATIIRCAILSAPAKRMTLNCIYNAIEEKYPYYHDAGPGWKNTVRHVLSTSQQFQKSRRPITEPGKGGYWSVNVSLPKADSSRSRRTNRSISKREHLISDPSPPIWAPAPIQEPTLHDYSYLRPMPADPNPDAEPRSFAAHAAQMAPLTQHHHISLPHYQDQSNAYTLMPHMTHMPTLAPYNTHPAHLMYPYEKAPERPGWLTEVSWGAPNPLGTITVDGRN